MSRLREMVRQVKPVEETYSRTPLDKVQDFLIEADTTDATNAEMAICYQYNFKKTKDREQALQDAGITPAKFKKVGDELLSIGQKVADQMKERGPRLIHSGSGSAQNFYEKGSDVTPKADFVGNNKNYISLKKAGDSGSGAQLMSAKSGEASGTVTAAVGHYENNSKVKLSKDKDFLKAISILEDEMGKTARNDLNIEVGKGKTDFEKWYTTSSLRSKELLKKHKKPQVEKHLKAELSMLGATRLSKGAEKNLIKGVRPLSAAQLKKLYDEYIDESEVKLGDVKVSARHLKKISPDKLTDPALRKQITEVIQTSVDSVAWQDQLTNFFNNNEELKKWMVYEAASGLYKFTGTSSNGKNYFGSESAVANRILVFYDNGIKSEYDILKYSMDNPQLVNKVSVSYKGSGRSKYIKLGIAAHYESELPLLQEEIEKLQRSFLLSEGIFQNIKNKLVNLKNKLQNIIKRFYERIIKRFINGLITLAQKGVNAFLEALGLEFEGNVSMKAPSW